VGDLVKAGGEKVEGRQNAAVWTQAVRFHHVLVVHLQAHLFSFFLCLLTSTVHAPQGILVGA